MTFYPKIAELHYKDKHINTVLSLRISYIELREFECSKCKDGGTIKQIHRFCRRELKDEKQHPDLKWSHSMEFGGDYVPTKIMKSKSYINCPLCYTQDSNFNRMKVKPKPLFKVWTTAISPHVRVESLVTQFFVGRWKHDHVNMKEFNPKLCSYYNSLKEVRKALNWFNSEKVKVPRGQTIKVKILKVTLKQLKQEWLNYHKRKFIKRI